MTGLAQVVQEHGRAFEYDLMTRTGRTLAEYAAMGADGMYALVAFAGNLPPDSATWREANPHEAIAASWATTARTNAILADIFDAYCSAHSRKGRRPRPYPRPGSDRGRTLGKGAIPVRDFMAWWNSR